MLERRWLLSKFPFRRGRRRAARLLGLSYLNIPLGSTVTSKPLGLVFGTGPDDVFFDLYFFGTYESFETQVMNSILRPGDTMFDIGSNFGWFSIHALAAVGSSGSVYAFEPQDELCEEVKANASRNGFADAIGRQLVIQNCAVGEKNGEVIFPSSRGRSHALMSLYNFGEKELANGGVAHKVIILDTFLSNLPQSLAPPRFVKCDVEGAEMSVLKGGASFFSSPQKPVLLIEVNLSAADSASWKPESMVAFLESCGYTDFIFMSYAQKPILLSPTGTPSRIRLTKNGNLLVFNAKLHSQERSRIAKLI
jgi:FkbM family methyltransferase